MCQRNFTQLLQSRKYEGLVWFMQSLGFCSIYKLKTQQSAIGGRQQPNVEYHRDFQMDLLRAAFSLVCKRTDHIGRYHLASYAEVFRIMYEKENVNRREICERAATTYEDLYRRCHVDEPEQSPVELFRMKCDAKNVSDFKNDTIIQTKTFFTRFSRPCNTFQAFLDSYHSSASTNGNSNGATHSFGQALANDTAFMNGLSGFLKKALLAYSTLPHLVLRTRLLLQHFPLAAIYLSQKMREAYRCKLRESNEYFREENGEITEAANITNHMPEVESTTIYLENTVSTANGENATDECSNFDATVYEHLDETLLWDFESLGHNALLGVYIEFCLLLGIVLNTVVLSALLYQTRNHLSTATILFIFNILFSNALFVASFVCLFSTMLSDISYLKPDEELPATNDAALFVAETLQVHLYAPSEFLKNLAQETLFSLAQNGSLLGLTHLLVLVLVVINRSMAGKAIKLSRKCVVSVFTLVWLFLIVTHVLFSALQYSAITNLDQLISKVKTHTASMQCNRSQYSDFVEIGQRCDLISVFHDFGVYLLRGHTLFTLCFLVASVVVFSITFLCHWRVRSQHDFLTTNSTTGMREHSPHRRRETLFNTLLLSLGAFFISVSGQSFIEIAVFWVDDRADVASLAKWYQLTRIAAFVDPLLNPILVAIRTPAIRRRLRFYICLAFGLFCAVCCPWWNSKRKRRHRHHKRKPSSTICTTAGYTSSGGYSSRRASSATFTSTDSQITLRILCTKQFIRASILRRNGNSTCTHSVV
ncbi:hypothetical protein DdX_01006 [Ditylenchus destructor]|uniref:G-protein coupled receptors family 1 profile domain-containing protein n=1 Tax=Ditylenchus destructor TaxID=166010 RepID=A0AAD4NKW5_9BILA|nr:hypothetical protein DdX_01006 [Ditylenchus destructor]